MATSSKQLMKVLATPSKVASALDWKRLSGGAIATLDVHADRIGVQISHHPKTSPMDSSSSKERFISRYSLPVSPKGKSKISDSTREHLSDLVHQHKVCGFVVSWPLQEDTGMMGAACGRTLFAIEELLRSDEKATSSHEQSKCRPVFAPSRPLCLWDGSRRYPKQPIRDAFGRLPLHARTSDKTEHFASKEQYHQDESVVASNVWDDFVRIHWPEAAQELQKLAKES